MRTINNVLIINDGVDSTNKIAEKIAGELQSYHVVKRKAADLEGTDVLPADAYFIGCERSDPPSFVYLSELMHHINLVGRPCGVFTHQSKTSIKYLAGLIRDAELTLNPAAFTDNGELDLQEWVKATISELWKQSA
ncbi:hypothetical protein FACS1894200_08930 [Spirochaetia bacterium]|nr:hypothetical protein FACS1894200_08930 [Spirochaetia bacterium]